MVRTAVCTELHAEAGNIYDVLRRAEVWTEMRKPYAQADTATLFLIKAVDGNEELFPTVDIYRGCVSDQGSISYDWRSRPLRPFLDIPVIRRWLWEGTGMETCQTQERCRRPQSDLRVVDCLDQCVTMKPYCCQYLALSYVWGPPDETVLTTTASNIDVLEQKDSLINACGSGRKVPRIIRDAMSLTVALGFRYLWVDSLCIIQNNAGETRRNVHGMSKIYAGAHTTLVVPNCASVHSPVPGLFEKRPGPHCQFGSFTSSIHFNMRPQSLRHHVAQGPWAGRCWTLQEQLFAQRLLYLSSHEAYFCSGSSWRRESKQVCSESEREMQQWSPLKRHAVPKPEDVDYTIAQNGVYASDVFFEQKELFFDDLYFDIVEEYTQRNLTYASDRLPAFIGIYNSLNRGLEDLSAEITRGVLASLMPQALLWVLKRPLPERKQPVEDSTKVRSSWAWSSVMQGVTYPFEPSRSLIYDPDFGTSSQDISRTARVHEMTVIRQERLESMLQAQYPAQSGVGTTMVEPGLELSIESHAIIAEASNEIKHEYLGRLQTLSLLLNSHETIFGRERPRAVPSALRLGELGFWAVCIGIDPDPASLLLRYLLLRCKRAFPDSDTKSKPNEVAILAVHDKRKHDYFGLLLDTVDGKSRRLGVVELSLQAFAKGPQCPYVCYRYVVLC